MVNKLQQFRRDVRSIAGTFEREVQAFVDKRFAELKAGGMDQVEAMPEALGEAMAKYWSRTRELLPRALSSATKRHATSMSTLAKVETAKTSETADICSAPLPTEWGEIPDSAPLDVEVKWVHQNVMLIVEERGGKQPVLHYDRAQTRCPSHGARNWLQFAITNRKGFMDLLHRVTQGSDGQEESVRRERTKIEEIRRILEELREVKT
jgi:hypothetical protein